MSDPERPPARVRREPPRFRPVAVRRVAPVSARLIQVTLAGDELAGLTVDEPAASIRLLVPARGADALVFPTWNGNEFLFADGKRPPIRTFTPLHVDANALELDIDVVVHDHGVASEWAQRAAPGDPAAVSGPGPGYTIDRDAPAFLLAGDETAIPAITQLLEALSHTTPVRVIVEVAAAGARLALPEHPLAEVTWHDLAPGAPPGTSLVDAVRKTDLVPGARVWAAGEAAAMQRIRRYLFEQRALPRARTAIRGYWKHGRARGDD